MQLWQWAAVCLAAFLVGVSKTGVAGLGILAVALFATILPARESVGAVLVTLIAGDIVAVASYRREVSWPQLWRLFPWAALGVVLGALALGRINDATLRRLIGGLLVLLIALQLARQTLRGGAVAAEPGPQPRWLAALTGVLAGFTTMLANASGPIMVLYLLAQRLPKLLFIGTAAWFFLVLNLFKLPFSVGLGLISGASLAISARLIPFAVAGALAGRPLLERIDQRRFEQLALGLTLLAGLRLLL